MLIFRTPDKMLHKYILLSEFVPIHISINRLLYDKCSSNCSVSGANFSTFVFGENESGQNGPIIETVNVNNMLLCSLDCLVHYVPIRKCLVPAKT